MFYSPALEPQTGVSFTLHVTLWSSKGPGAPPDAPPTPKTYRWARNHWGWRGGRTLGPLGPQPPTLTGVHSYPTPSPLWGGPEPLSPGWSSGGTWVTRRVPTGPLQALPARVSFPQGISREPSLGEWSQGPGGGPVRRGETSGVGGGSGTVRTRRPAHPCSPDPERCWESPPTVPQEVGRMSPPSALLPSPGRAPVDRHMSRFVDPTPSRPDPASTHPRPRPPSERLLERPIGPVPLRGASHTRSRGTPWQGDRFRSGTARSRRRRHA